MAIRAIPIRKPSSALREQLLSDYETFARRFPDFISQLSSIRGRWKSQLVKLQGLKGSAKHQRVRRLLKSPDLYPLFAFEALRRAHRLRNASTQTVVDLIYQFNPFGPVPDEPIMLKMVGIGQARLVQDFGPIRRMHQIAVDGILRALHPLREQQKLFNGGMPKALRAIEEAYHAGMTHCCEVDFIDFYRSVQFDGLPELLRPLPKSVTEHVVWDTASKTTSQRPSTGTTPPTLEMPAGLSLGSATSPIVGEIIIAHLLAAAQLDDAVTYADNLMVFGASEGEVQARVQRLRDSIASADAGISRLRVRCTDPIEIGCGIEFASHQGDATEGAFFWSPSQRKLDDFMSSARDYVTLPKINRAIKQVSSWRRYYESWPDGERLEAEYLAALKARRFYLDRSPANCIEAVSSIVDAWSLAAGERHPAEFLPDWDVIGTSYRDPRGELLHRVDLRIRAIENTFSRRRTRTN